MALRIRKKKNTSGSVSIQIVDRTNRGYKVVETIGCSCDEDKVEQFYEKALVRIDELSQNLFSQAVDDSTQKILLKKLLSRLTTQDLIPNGYKYILAAKIKNISNDLKNQISNLTFIDDNTTHTLRFTKDIPYADTNDTKQTININQRLILSYSTQRAKKDKYNRTKALERLEKKIKTQKSITKKDLKLSYYAKYLNLDDNKCDVTFKIDSNKVLNDEKLDGVKGFITNDFQLTSNDVISHYNNQYDVERAFRISRFKEQTF